MAAWAGGARAYYLSDSENRVIFASISLRHRGDCHRYEYKLRLDDLGMPLSRVLKSVLSLAPMVLVSEATVYKHTKGNTLYVSIPSKMAQDSAFTIKEGDEVKISFENGAIVIRPKTSGGGKKVPS
jgi:Antidote-toxin recognition MazE, bacterial antitoxin